MFGLFKSKELAEKINGTVLIKTRTITGKGSDAIHAAANGLFPAI